MIILKVFRDFQIKKKNRCFAGGWSYRRHAISSSQERDCHKVTNQFLITTLYSKPITDREIKMRWFACRHEFHTVNFEFKIASFERCSFRKTVDELLKICTKIVHYEKASAQNLQCFDRETRSERKVSPLQRRAGDVQG